MTLNDKVALITGASRGIGRAISIALGQLGARVIGTATTQEGAEKITEYLRNEQITGSGYALNVCDPEAITQLVKEVNNDFGPIAILVNNAGIAKDNILLRMRPEEWSAVLDTNLNAIYYTCKNCLKPMMKARWGRIINISSVVGVMGNPGQANYVAAKAGMIGLSKSLAQEMSAFNITVNCVAPGFIETDMTDDLTEQQREMIHSKIPMRRIGKPEEVAAMVAFLATEQAGYITGQTFHVNGGMCMV